MALSLAKGLAKTELGAVITAAELHPDAPVRCVNWWKRRGGPWEPEGGPVRSPYIPVLATAEHQVQDLGFGVLLDMLGASRYARELDIGLERIMRRNGDGKGVQPMSSAPNSKDGALTTFQWFDETHRLYLPNQLRAHQTMLANMPKRPLADPWALETTTAFATGQGSIAERTMAYARQIAEQKVRDQHLFFFHRQASPQHDLRTVAGRRAAVVEARGPEAAAWSDIPGICAQWDDPTRDPRYLARVWLNQPNAAAGRAFDAEQFAGLARAEKIPDGALVTLGFDGSRTSDATGIIITEVVTGLQEVVGIWENPGRDDWEVPDSDVDAAMAAVFARWDVWRAYCDPYWWESYVAKWAGDFGEKRVVSFATNSIRRIAPALRAYAAAIASGELTHTGHPSYLAHVGNACRRETQLLDPEGRPVWTIAKEREDSPFKIDLAMAGCLSWQARLDAVAAGAKPQSKRPPSVIFAD